jgi:deoxyribonuclease IV
MLLPRPHAAGCSARIDRVAAIVIYDTPIGVRQACALSLGAVRTTIAIGAHVEPADPLAEARARDASAVQFFLSDPQGWQEPQPRPDEAALRASDIDVYVHAPYRINVVTLNNRIRIPSRKLLLSHAKAAAQLGARGLIVHGGHVNTVDELPTGIDNWRKTFAYAAESGGFGLPVLIENTAGGENATARSLDSLARLWDVIGSYHVGFCLDTCHAHAAGEELAGLADRVKAITGRVDLVHANGSKGEFASGQDRHDNLTTGTIDPEMIVELVAAAGAPAVVETPGGVVGQAADIAFLRERLRLRAGTPVA